MRTFLFLIFILSYSQNMFSQTKTDIDTIYKQDFKDFSLQLVRDDSGEKQAEFRTLFINKKMGISTKIFISTYKKDSNWTTNYLFSILVGE